MEFRKAIKELMIDDSERTKITINNLETEKDKAFQESENMRQQFAKRSRDQDREILGMKQRILELERL